MERQTRTQVTFVTKLFNTEEVMDYFINPCCFGDDCAQWLIDRLASQNIEKIDEKPTQEDWGWCFSVSTGQQDFLIGVGLTEDAEPSDTWLVFVESQIGWFGRRFLGRSDGPALLEACVAVDRALKTAPGISDVRWHYKEDVMKGRDDKWRSTPSEV
jgi:hypothetical protein